MRIITKDYRLYLLDKEDLYDADLHNVLCHAA